MKVKFRWCLSQEIKMGDLPDINYLNTVRDAEL